MSLYFSCSFTRPKYTYVIFSKQVGKSIYKRFFRSYHHKINLFIFAEI